MEILNNNKSTQSHMKTYVYMIAFYFHSLVEKCAIRRKFEIWTDKKRENNLFSIIGKVVLAKGAFLNMVGEVEKFESRNRLKGHREHMPINGVGIRIIGVVGDLPWANKILGSAERTQ